MRGLMALGLAIVAVIAETSAAQAQVPSLKLAAHRIEAVARQTGFSGEIVLADQTGPLSDQTWGLADHRAKTPHRQGAAWLWASVTKQLTAILVMQEVEAGHLSLDGTITSYIPQFPGRTGSHVSLRQMLQHTSGLPNPDETPKDGAGVPQFYGETGPAIRDTPRALDYCSGPVANAPGQGFSYNNCDYLVLGAILERVTGQPFDQLVTSRLARPLGLKSLKLAPDGAPRGGTRSEGYLANAVAFPPVNVATFGAAGALTGTALDLARINRALMAGKLLRPESLKVLWEGDPALGYVALGAWAFPADLAGCPAPVALVERRGDVAGVQVRNILAPEQGRSVVIFTNEDSLDFGEVWQGKGLTFDLLSATFCPGA